MTAPIRIAYLANFAPKKLGTGENRLMLLAQHAAAQGHHITLYCHEPVHDDVAAAFGAAGQRIAELSNVSIRTIATIRDFARNFDAIILNAFSPRSRIAITAYLAWPTKIFYVDHNSGPANDIDYENQAAWRRFADYLTLIRVHRAAGVSEYVRDRLQRRFQLNDARVRALYGGVDTERYRPLDRENRNGRLQITVVAALIPEKGVDVLLQAVAEANAAGWQLWIVGEGPDEPRLQELTATLGVGDVVEFLGLRDDVDQLLQATDIFVHPATWNEALGYTVLEGMSSGCAVVASATGAIPEIIRHKDNGFLVTPGSVSEMRDALHVLAQDTDLRRRLGVAARETVVRDFGLEKNVRETLEWIVEGVRG